jgi:phage-related minor tail protein
VPKEYEIRPVGDSDAPLKQLIELVRSNQKVIDDLVRANTALHDELSSVAEKLSELVDLIKESGEIEGPETPIAVQLVKLTESNRRLSEGQAALFKLLDELNRKVKVGTPVSSLLSSYPNLKLRR